mmetsp:Transcript_112474/g.350529  ORF Transcript_112474/g.350529 Transcript_112474/m.350529 type:complete len:267 (+) Transcript_112474:671-1471(+)
MPLKVARGNAEALTTSSFVSWPPKGLNNARSVAAAARRRLAPASSSSGAAEAPSSGAREGGVSPPWSIRQHARAKDCTSETSLRRLGNRRRCSTAQSRGVWPPRSLAPASARCRSRSSATSPRPKEHAKWRGCLPALSGTPARAPPASSALHSSSKPGPHSWLRALCRRLPCEVLLKLTRPCATSALSSVGMSKERGRQRYVRILRLSSATHVRAVCVESAASCWAFWCLRVPLSCCFRTALVWLPKCPAQPGHLDRQDRWLAPNW